MARIVVTQDNATVYVGNNDTVVIDIPGGGTVNIVADPNETVKKFTIEFGDDTEADTANVDLSSFSRDDLRINIKKYDTSDRLNLDGAFGTGVDPNRDDQFNFSYEGADNDTYSAYVRAMDGGEKDFTADPSPIIICFAAGTIIDTELGPRPVEGILAGDRVRTHDNGLQPVLWVGRKRLDTLDLARAPHLYPIRVRQGALGGGRPWADLMLSPQHRVLLGGSRIELLVGEPSALAAIKHFDGCDGVAQDSSVASVTYYHLLFDRHEVVSANGVLCESLHTGEMALAGADASLFATVLAQRPELTSQLLHRPTAHMVLKRYETLAAVRQNTLPGLTPDPADTSAAPHDPPNTIPLTPHRHKRAG